MRALIGTALVGLALMQLQPARAEDYPTRLVTIIAPSAPGGLYSLFARILGSRLEQRLGKTFVVENPPGAAPGLGGPPVARAAPRRHPPMVASAGPQAGT